MLQLGYRQVPVDPGFEPPISTEGASLKTPVRTRLNLRWLAGLLLIGTAGSALLVFSVGGALGPYNDLISRPKNARKDIRDDRIGESGAFIAARRTDKLTRRVNLVAARQDYRAPVQVRVGDAEITRQANFTRLSTLLSAESLGFADSVPAFNLTKLVASASADRAALENEGTAPSDSEVGLTMRDIATAQQVPDSRITINVSDSYAQVWDWLSERRSEPQGSDALSRLARIARTPVGTPMTTPSGTNGLGDPFSKLVVRMVQENVSVLPRAEALFNPLPLDDKLVSTRTEAQASQILRQYGASPAQIRDILSALTQNSRANAFEGPRIVKIALQPSEAGGTKEIMRVEVFADEQRVAAAGRRDNGAFVSITADEAAAKTSPARNAQPNTNADEEEEEDTTRLTLFASIYETARRHDIPPALIDEAIRTIFFDVDLQRRVGPSDSIEFLIQNGETEAAKPELLLVALQSGGVKRRYYRFKMPDEDVIDYFDDQGRSAKQFLLRKPVDGGELRSTFGMRRHPILRYYRLHSGVDWAAPVGTPIRAAGNGTIRMAAWDSGYGRRIEIEHTNGYVTTYNHLSAFAAGISEGARVRQGQVIGRMGSSGLSTGSHLHYEVMINEKHVDPLAIKLPRGRELSGRALALFKRETQQAEAVLKLAPGAGALAAN